MKIGLIHMHCYYINKHLYYVIMIQILTVLKCFDILDPQI